MLPSFVRLISATDKPAGDSPPRDGLAELGRKMRERIEERALGHACIALADAIGKHIGESEAEKSEKP